MREKLIELLDKATKVFRFDAWENTDRIADYLIANGVTIEKWIPVSDPPKENGSYLVATERGGVFITHYWKDGKRFSSKWSNGITHWKERPLPPKKEE